MTTVVKQSLVQPILISKYILYVKNQLSYRLQQGSFLTTSNFKTFLSELKQKSTCLKVHSVAKVYAVLPFYDVKCLCSGGRE